MDDRPRTAITRIGNIWQSNDGDWWARGWRFEAVPGQVVPVHGVTEDGTAMWCGWTGAELLAVVEDAQALRCGLIDVEEIVG